MKIVHCKCGCGQIIKKYDKRERRRYYVKGHYWKGRPLAKTTIENARKVNKSRKPWNYGKTKKEFPQLANSGAKKGNTPWNKGKKMRDYMPPAKIQKWKESLRGKIPWNKGKKMRDYMLPAKIQKWKESLRGKIPWNKGLTKETNKSLERISKIRKGKTLKELFGKKKAKMMITQLAKSHKGKKQSKTTKRKRSKSMVGKNVGQKRSKEVRNKMSVIQIEIQKNRKLRRIHSKNMKKLHKNQRFLEKQRESTRLFPRHHLKTKKGKKVRSKKERFIADYLTSKKIKYNYEPNPPIILEGHIFHPDFYIPRYKKYVEYYGGYCAPKEKLKDYNKQTNRKQRLYKKYKIPVISLFPGNIRDLDKNLLEKLKKRI